MRRLLAALALLAVPLPAGSSEDIIAGLSQNQVSITTDFAGSEIFIYGAVRREAPAPDGPPLDIIVVVIGPLEPVTVRRKERSFGLWVNGSAVRVDQAPSFYAVATTRPFREAISWTDDLQYRVGLDHVVRLIGMPTDEAYPEEFRRAVVRLRTAQGLYYEAPGTVTVTEDTLFQTAVQLPANLVEGLYTTRVFLLRGGDVVSAYATAIDVQKVGIERWLFELSRGEPVVYGLLAISVALFAGWLAAAVFRYIFR